jgi:hypothetical protein
LLQRGLCQIVAFIAAPFANRTGGCLANAGNFAKGCVLPLQLQMPRNRGALANQSQ